MQEQIKSLSKGLKVYRYIVNYAKPIKAVTLCQKLDIDKSSMARILKTLHNGVLAGDYPFVPGMIVSDINVGVLFVMGVMATGLYGPLLGGMAQANKWGLLGGARTAIQLLSYEVVTGLSMLAPLMLVGSLSLIDINNYQAGGIQNWLIFTQPLAFILFLIAGYAETNRTPFDLLEHEAEVVAGYATEYSGMRWGMFFIGEYANLFTVSFVTVLMFLGGFNDLWFIPGGIAIILKVMFLIFLFLWTRASWPHVRPDQLMWLCWKVLMPLALLNILVTAIVAM